MKNGKIWLKNNVKKLFLKPNKLKTTTLIKEDQTKNLKFWLKNKCEKTIYKKMLV
ncbi:protein ORF65 [Lake sturgeon herpesvirus]|nr:protein ORF65 [Lake sturgeon herpesvirus]